ncbi:hypothetical protein ACOMHN_040832 [Nucella lapillus]
MQRGEKETTFDPSSAFTQPPPADGPAFPPATSRPAVGSGQRPLSSKHPTQLPTTDCLLSIMPLMGGQPSDAPALSPPSPLQQGGQSSNAPALSPPSPLPQGGQPIALALSPSSSPPQDGQPSDAPGLSPSSSTLLLCPSDSTLSICHLNSQSAVKTETRVCFLAGLWRVSVSVYNGKERPYLPILQIIIHHPDFLYIGSSVNLRHRWANHKSDCKLRKGHKCHVAQHFLDKQHPVDPQFTCLRIFAIKAVHKKENLDFLCWC